MPRPEPQPCSAVAAAAAMTKAATATGKRPSTVIRSPRSTVAIRDTQAIRKNKRMDLEKHDHCCGGLSPRNSSSSGHGCPSRTGEEDPLEKQRATLRCHLITRNSRAGVNRTPQIDRSRRRVDASLAGTHWRRPRTRTIRRMLATEVSANCPGRRWREMVARAPRLFAVDRVELGERG